MLFLVFQLGTDRYAIEAHQVIEVLHLVNLKHIPQAPSGVAGIFDYHGASVPLIDLAELAVGEPSRRWMSTRIIVVNYGPRFRFRGEHNHRPGCSCPDGKSEIGPAGRLLATIARFD